MSKKLLSIGDGKKELSLIGDGKKELSLLSAYSYIIPDCTETGVF